MYFLQVKLTDLFTSELRPQQSTPFHSIGGELHNYWLTSSSPASPRFPKQSSTILPELKVLKLNSQQGLNILEVDRKDKITPEVAHYEGSDISLLKIAHELDTALRQLWQELFFVGSQRLFQIVNSDGVNI
ncbi:uncharacterized protein N7458_004368 [Penicillium daleae]|uniref:Uncharacterized protein n=1 Tax=Penicillium daleae TaxID=63821 RepID=A0AAD6C8P5_9EURO|nr:uncharacterized protein N7458_004368 [Penicillium daleae]KAJ5453412.1 hypothetical protein N7458_004368 [Penicillium daleae]